MDMRNVCPKDVKKMPLQQAGMVYWKKWAAKRECEELKESYLAETKEGWTEKHRNVARKLVLEGGWVQQKLGRK